jgi:hypothetical protein
VRHTSGRKNLARTVALLLRTVLTAAAIAVLQPVIAPPPAYAMSTVEFLGTLSDSEAANFQDWKAARRAYEDKLDVYWDAVDAKRQARKKKRAAKTPFDASDYVMSFPPKYEGPKLGDSLAKKYEAFRAAQEKAQPTPPKELSVVADYLAAAKRVYNFVPERLTEQEFKRRYADEAVRLGLSKDQVVRVYALETGGYGTYDMQAGIHPIKKTGRAISSALGYAQLLDANSVNELSKSGDVFIERLQQKARTPNLTAERLASLKSKISVVRKMYAAAKRVPFEWEVHQAYAKTLEGMAPHTLNIDGDIGPVLQAMKLRSIKDIAAKAGRPNLAGAELEAMNLAGPVTGLEMMQPAGQKAPVTNFFARRAYYVNKMVIGLTGEQLLAELDRRMTDAVKLPGSVEFAAAFDSVLLARSAGR